jgi:hypothetical protein
MVECEVKLWSKNAGKLLIPHRKAQHLRVPGEQAPPGYAGLFVWFLRHAIDVDAGSGHMPVAKRSGSLSEIQDALGHRHASTTRIYVDSIAVKTDKYNQHIFEALELPGFEIDFSMDSGADQETNDKAAV